ncbi:MAG: hypothetical protein IJU78_02790 [Clostridia bacterium]|nr:hypothetical protein [Clostridia bacterium]
MQNRVKRYILPGLIFQSVIISGGYGTGAELKSYFLTRGPRGALLGLLVTALIWAAVCAATFELARRWRAYDYRSFFTRLLGRGWRLYELAYLALLLISLAVIYSAAGICALGAGLPAALGSTAAAVCIVLLVLRGTAAVEGFLSLWSYLLYAVYLCFFIACLTRFGGGIRAALGSGQTLSGWAGGGARYAFYNLGMIPAALHSARFARTRREALLSGVFAALIAAAPALLLLLAMCGTYPAVLTCEAPVRALLAALDMPLLSAAFQLVLFGTLIETGAGLIKAVTQRFDSASAPSPARRAAITAALAAAGGAVSMLGLEPLVVRGYGGVSWVFLAVYVAPVLYAGAREIFKKI